MDAPGSTSDYRSKRKRPDWAFGWPRQVVAENLGGDHSVRDAIAAVAEGEEKGWRIWGGSEIGQAVLRFLEGTRPGCLDLEVQVREEGSQFFLQLLRFGAEQFFIREIFAEFGVFAKRSGRLQGMFVIPFR